MKLIIATFVICAIVVYVYIDYDNLKQKYFGGKNNEIEVVKKEPKEYATSSTEKQNTNEIEQKAKFKGGEEVYINAAVGDLMAWKQNRVPAWVTYDGSPNDENQQLKDYFNHREIVKIIKFAVGRENKIWYYVRTPRGFPLSGWVEEKYLSKEAPERRPSTPPERGM